MADNEHDEFFGETPSQNGDGAPQEDPNKEDPEKEKKRKTARRIAAIVLAVIIFAVGILTGWLIRLYTIDEDIRAFLWALETTQAKYYLDIDVDAVYAGADTADGGEGLIASLESQLDAYSGYYTLEEYEALVAAGEGQNVGIGVSIYTESADGETRCRVLLVIENSPAQEAGICKGMYILGYGSGEDDLTAAADSTEVSSFISGQTDDFYLRFGYEADGSDAVTASLRRESYQAAYCYYRDSETSYSFRGDTSALYLTETYNPIEGLDDETAYIRIDEFSGYAATEFQYCLQVMCERERTNLILDIRTNGGGYLSILQSIASHLCKNAEGNYPAVLTAQYKSGLVVTYPTTAGNDYYDYFTEESQIYLLADENTASASECLIGVLIDYGALTYDHIYLREDSSGEASTYGKGIMQSFYAGALGVMKLTVATVHWPVSANCIHGVGVTGGDGAHAIAADLVWGKDDVMLNAVIADVCVQSESGGDDDVSYNY